MPTVQGNLARGFIMPIWRGIELIQDRITKAKGWTTGPDGCNARRFRNGGFPSAYYAALSSKPRKVVSWTSSTTFTIWSTGSEAVDLSGSFRYGSMATISDRGDVRKETIDSGAFLVRHRGPGP